MVENLNDFLPRHGFFDIAVDRTERFLLTGVVFTAQFRNRRAAFGKHRHEQDGNQRQFPVGGHHKGERADKRDYTRHNVDKRVVEHHIDVVHVVRKPAHHLARRVVIEKADGQAVQFTEQIVADFLGRALRGREHQPRLQIGGRCADRIHQGQHDKRRHKVREHFGKFLVADEVFDKRRVTEFFNNTVRKRRECPVAAGIFHQTGAGGVRQAVDDGKQEIRAAKRRDGGKEHTEEDEEKVDAVGGSGKVKVGNETFELGYKEALYIGRGDRDVVFMSDCSEKPAKFYINSTTAHKEYPCKKVTKADADILALGTLEDSNDRVINRMIVQKTLDSCQLQMGMTELKPGSVWNTMPAHIHSRRMEAYFYFEVPEDQAVCHFMGEIEETRHIWMKGDQAVLSPEWSIHSAAATHNYTFIWGMGGENQDYGDQDFYKITDLK